MVVRSYFHADVRYSVMCVFIRPLWPSHWLSLGIRRYPLVPGAKEMSREGEGFQPGWGGPGGGEDRCSVLAG